MPIFNLPDLGEGLPDAEIHEWFVKEGDTVQADMPMVSMETAKALVEVPCPQSGTILKLFGEPGDVIKTGKPLVEFEVVDKAPDQGTVVGHLEESAHAREDTFQVGSTSAQKIRATPAVRLLAKKLGVDLSSLVATGENGVITKEDVEKHTSSALQTDYVPLKGTRRMMWQSMTLSHAEVVPVTIFDEADVHSWPEKEDITVRLIQAMVKACQTEPALNAWFDGKQGARKCMDNVNIGLAMDSEEGLFVPVIENAGAQSASSLRKIIDEYKKAVHTRTIAPENLKNASITLSNFGKFAGKFASPIILPPMVAILGVGRMYKAVVAEAEKSVVHKILPLSLSFDHRAVTGGEATRFLGAVINALQSG
jgi:2-oxoisovalerate dehydrogenase E2 component (dihydrolipoyl transacylase)